MQIKNLKMHKEKGERFISCLLNYLALALALALASALLCSDRSKRNGLFPLLAARCAGGRVFLCAARKTSPLSISNGKNLCDFFL